MDSFLCACVKLLLDIETFTFIGIVIFITKMARKHNKIAHEIQSFRIYQQEIK